MLTLIHVLVADALSREAHRVFFLTALIAGFLSGIFGRKR